MKVRTGGGSCGPTVGYVRKTLSPRISPWSSVWGRVDRIA